MAVDAYVVADMAMRALVELPLFVIWAISMCLARRRSDHARVFTGWMKAAPPFLILSIVTYVVAQALLLIYLNFDDLYSDSDSYYGGYSDDDEAARLALGEAYSRLFLLSTLFENVAQFAVLVALVELGNGYLYCQTGLRTTLQKAARWAALAAAAVLFVLTLAYFGRVNAITSSAYSCYRGDDERCFAQDFSSAYLQANRVGYAVDILLWIASIATLAYASFAFAKCQKHPILKKTLPTYLAIAVLFLLRNTWCMARDIHYYMEDSLEPTPSYAAIIDAVLNVWTTFVLLVLLFVVGVRKKVGLWTTFQPWMQAHGVTSMAPAAPQQQALQPHPHPHQGFQSQQGFPQQGWQQPAYGQAAYQQPVFQQNAYSQQPQPQPVQTGWHQQQQHMQPQQEQQYHAPIHQPYAAQEQSIPREVSPEPSAGYKEPGAVSQETR